MWTSVEAHSVRPRAAKGIQLPEKEDKAGKVWGKSSCVGIRGICTNGIPTGRTKAKTGSVDLRVNERGRKRVLTPEDSERIAKAIDSQPDITLSEIVEKLSLPVGIETVRRAIQAMGYRRKKKMIHASEQERPDQAWVGDITHIPTGVCAPGKSWAMLFLTGLTHS